MALSSPLPAGYILGGRYRIEKRIGAGGIGVVYEARDLEKNQLCALKVLHGQGSIDDVERRRFLGEAIYSQRLQHPNIVRVTDIVVEQGKPVAIVMDLLRGQDLARALYPRRRFPADRAVRILYSVCCALGYAHAVGIVHRDVKLENIFLHLHELESGQSVEEVKLIDLGLAKSRRSRQFALTMQGFVMGTPLYMAPEATRGVSSLVDERVDQWAVAVVAYRMLSGRFPFERLPGEDSDYPLLLRIQNQPPIPLRIVVPGLPEHVYHAVEKALTKDKEDRFSSIDSFARKLQGLSQAVPALSSLLEEPGENVPLPRGELPTREVRFKSPGYQALLHECRELSYQSIHIEKDASGATREPAASVARRPAALAHSQKETAVAEPRERAADSVPKTAEEPPRRVEAPEKRPTSLVLPAPQIETIQRVSEMQPARSMSGNRSTWRNIALGALAFMSTVSVANLAVSVLTRGPASDPGAAATVAAEPERTSAKTERVQHRPVPASTRSPAPVPSAERLPGTQPPPALQSVPSESARPLGRTFDVERGGKKSPALNSPSRQRPKKTSTASWTSAQRQQSASARRDAIPRDAAAPSIPGPPVRTEAFPEIRAGERPAARPGRIQLVD